MSGVVIADVRGNDRDETAAGCLRGVNWPVKLLSSLLLQCPRWDGGR